MKSRTLTLQQLIDVDACQTQVDLFKTTFGDQVKVTVTLAKKYAQHFDFDFAANHLLSTPAWTEYNKVKAAAWTEYNKVKAPAWAEYDKVSAAAWANAYINDVGV